MNRELKPGDVFKVSESIGPVKKRCSYVVIRTTYDGGGTGHGPHDVYPDGHRVVAANVITAKVVKFYQTGCFIDMIPKEKVELLETVKSKPMDKILADYYLFEVELKRDGHYE